MSRRQRAADLRPALYPFGLGELPRLSREEEATAAFEDRLRSVWMFLVGKAMRFEARLSDRERANLSAEDLMQFTVESLIEKDRLWEPARGRYLKFAAIVLRNVIAARLGRARVVEAPPGATSRLEEYRRRDAAGSLSGRCRRTMAALETVLSEVEAITDFGGAVEIEPDDGPRREITAALKGFDSATQVHVLAAGAGLFNAFEQTPTQIGVTLGIDRRRVQAIQKRARASLKERVEKLRETPTS